jgi:6-phosphogluconolactonase
MQDPTVLADPEALSQHVAGFLADTLSAAPGQPAVALSGGSTPERLFELLATPQFRDRLPWDRIHWFWGDERFVPPDHPDSNFRMAALAFLDLVPVPPDHIHAVPTLGLTPDAAASAYARSLQDFYGADRLDPARPLFEVNLLGLGEDGHTASLFPGVPALDETERWAVAVLGARPEPRISLTFPVLGSARHVVFMIAGAGKHAVLQRIRAGEDLPAGRVHTPFTLHWMLDRAAAGTAP